MCNASVCEGSCRAL